MTEAPSTKFSIYIVLDDEEKRLITHKKYDVEQKQTVLTFNNPKSQVIRVCIDNFEAYQFMVDIQVKMSHQLGNFDNVPDFTDINDFSKNLNKVLKEMQVSQTYFDQNQTQQQEIIDSSSSYNKFLIFSSILTIFFTVSIGFFQVCIVRIDLKKKKEW